MPSRVTRVGTTVNGADVKGVTGDGTVVNGTVKCVTGPGTSDAVTVVAAVTPTSAADSGSSSPPRTKMDYSSGAVDRG